MTLRTPEARLAQEAAQILYDLSARVMWVSEQGALPENLAAAARGEVDFLDFAREHEVPVSDLVSFAKEIAALHARIVAALRNRERELAPDH